MKINEASRIAREMNGAGKAYPEISAALAEAGYLSRKTGMPLTGGGVSRLIHRPMRRRSVAAAPAMTGGASMAEKKLGVIEAMLRMPMADADKLAAIHLAMGF